MGSLASWKGQHLLKTVGVVGHLPVASEQILLNVLYFSCDH